MFCLELLLPETLEKKILIYDVDVKRLNLTDFALSLGSFDIIRLSSPFIFTTTKYSPHQYGCYPFPV